MCDINYEGGGERGVGFEVVAACADYGADTITFGASEKEGDFGLLEGVDYCEGELFIAILLSAKCHAN